MEKKTTDILSNIKWCPHCNKTIYVIEEIEEGGRTIRIRIERESPSKKEYEEAMKTREKSRRKKEEEEGGDNKNRGRSKD